MKIEHIDEFLPYLERVRSRTERVIDRVPRDRLEWRPGAGRFSAGDLIRHIAGTERWMWAENVHGRPSRYPGHGAELADGWEAVRSYFDTLHEEAVALFARLTPEQLQAKCPTVGGIEITTWKWLRSMVEHEVHHRGQLYSVLGQMGVAGPPLYGLSEPEVFARSEPRGGSPSR